MHEDEEGAWEYDYDDDDDPNIVCEDCGRRTQDLVPTPGGQLVCRDCYMGENWED